MKDDLISRRAAIDAVVAWTVEDRPDIEMPTDLVGRIKALPSAQPEVIRCKDCRHYNAGFECLIEGYGIERNKDWFCADAERREDD